MHGEGDEAAFAAGYGALKSDHVTCSPTSFPARCAATRWRSTRIRGWQRVIELWFGAQPRTARGHPRNHHGYVMGDGATLQAPRDHGAVECGYTWNDEPRARDDRGHCTVSYCNVVDQDA